MLTRTARNSFNYFLLNFLLFNLLRVVFYFIFLAEADLDFSSLIKSFYIGAKFDARLAAILGFIFFIISSVINKKSWQLFFALGLSALTSVLYLADFLHYSYLQSRISFALLKFLQTPLLSLKMLWQSYPVVILIFALIFYLFALYKVLSYLIKTNPIQGQRSWKKTAISTTLIILFFVACGYGKLSYYPLRWSDAFFSTRQEVSNLTLNPVLYLLDTRKFSDLQNDKSLKEKFEKYAPYVKSYLGLSENQSFIRKNIHNKAKKMNIVVVVLESQAAYKTGTFGSTINPTPYLDQLISESLLFEKFFVPTQATARSMFTFVTGLPDLSVVKTGSRNPFIVNQHSIINEFKEHKKFFFLGGSANWGNIRGIFSNNISNLNIFEEGDFNSPRVDVWGISDYDLMTQAHNVFEKHTQDSDDNFIGIIQSSGFHRPYSIPSHVKGFEVITDISEDELKQNGFISIDEYNSLRFQDFSLGNFMKLAKKSSYYKDTLFVFYGDHGLPVLQAAHVPKGERVHNFENFHVPLVFHGPKFFTKSVDNKITSQLDLWPTLASFSQLNYLNTTLGRNIFSPKFANRDKAFIYYWYTNPPTFGLLGEKYFYKDNLSSPPSFFDYSGESPQENISDPNNPLFKEYQNLSRGFYYSSKYLMMNNPKLKNRN